MAPLGLALISFVTLGKSYTPRLDFLMHKREIILSDLQASQDSCKDQRTQGT